MSDLLKRDAVSCLKGREADEILRAYLETGPAMVLSHAPGSMETRPKGTGAGDRLMEPR